MSTRPNEYSPLWGKPSIAACLLLLLAAVFLSYANTLQVAWHLDDTTNILENRNVHVTTLSPEDWLRSVRYPFSDPSKRPAGFYRPVAMLSFALNWYLGGPDVRGFHAVNIGIHAMTAVLLFFTILLLLRAPRLNGRYGGRETVIAFVATALWALHPIQTQAVTYIVQRMASLATFFYLLSVFAYVKARSQVSLRRRGLFFGLCFAGFLLAMGTKENTVTLPAALLLIELIFYADFDYQRHARSRWLTAAAVAGLLGFIVWGLYLWSDDPVASILSGYHGRPFTLSQRLLTQFRVLVLYLWQIVYPIPQQYCIVHDMALSTSLVQPWSTMASIALIGALVAGALVVVRKNPLVSFAILFFFLGHSVESSIFPLELIFEHRNYLPTLFVFLPAAAGLSALMRRYYRQNRLIYRLLVVFFPLVLLGIGFSTYVRNMAWLNEKTLWEDAMKKAPALARPYQGLARAVEKENQLDLALGYYERSLSLKDPAPDTSRFIALSNMGNIYKRKGAYAKAVQLLSTAVSNEKGPYVNRVRFNLVLCLLHENRQTEALEHLGVLLARKKDDSTYLMAKGLILLDQEKIEPALDHLKQAHRGNPQDVNVLLTLGMALSAGGEGELAERYLQAARKGAPGNIVIYLGLLQNAILMQDDQRTDQYLFQITRAFRIDRIQAVLHWRAKGHLYVDLTPLPLKDWVVAPSIAAYFRQQAAALAGGENSKL